MALFDLDAAVLAALRATATVTAAAPGGVHQDLAPSETKGVFVTVTLEPGCVEEYELGARIAWSERTYTVTAWGAGLAPALAEASGEAVDAAMLTPIALTGFDTMDVQRLDVLNRKVLDETGTWQRRGATYRIKAAP